MKKGIVAGLIVLCVALGAGTAAVVVTDDRKGPEIELPADGDVTYEEGSDTAPLLEGVTATDEKDGDVTDSLMIENIFPKMTIPVHRLSMRQRTVTIMYQKQHAA